MSPTVTRPFAPISLFAIIQRRFLKLRPQLRLQPSQFVAIPIDKLAAFGQRRMNLLDLAPHLLTHETIVGMALGHGAQLAHMKGFTQIDLHEPTASSDSFDLDVVRFFLNLGEIIFHLHAEPHFRT